MPQLPLAGSAQFGRRATPEDFGVGVGQTALGEATNQGAQITQRLYRVEAESQVWERASALVKDANDLRIALEQDPDYQNHETMFDEGSKELLQKYGDQLSIPGMRKDLARRVQPFLESSRLKVKEYSLARSTDATVANGLTAMNTYIDQAVLSETDGERQMHFGAAVEVLDGLVSRGAVTAVRAVAIREGMEAKLAAGELPIDAQAATDVLMEEFGSESDRLKAAHARFSGVLEERVVEDVKDRSAAERRELTELKTKAREDGITQALNGNLTRAKAREIPNLVGSDLKAVLALIDETEDGKPPKLDPEEYGRLKRLQATDPQAFTAEKLDPSKLGTKYTALVDAQAAILAGQATKGRSFTAMVEDVIDPLGLGEANPLRGDIHNEAERLLEEFEADAGRPSTRTEKIEILDDLETRIIKTGGFLGFGQTTTITPRQEVPEEYLEQIDSELRRVGKPVTDEERLNLYLKAKREGRID